jgi:hypothetical protein
MTSEVTCSSRQRPSRSKQSVVCKSNDRLENLLFWRQLLPHPAGLIPVLRVKSRRRPPDQAALRWLGTWPGPIYTCSYYLDGLNNQRGGHVVPQQTTRTILDHQCTRRVESAAAAFAVNHLSRLHQARIIRAAQRRGHGWELGSSQSSRAASEEKIPRSHAGKPRYGELLKSPQGGVSSATSRRSHRSL